MTWTVSLEVDDATAYAAFATDRAWTGYAIADLDEPFRAYSRVAVARRGDQTAAMLVLRHPAFTSIVPHGPPEGLAAILARAELPAETHLFGRDEHLETLDRWFAWDGRTAMWRMVAELRAGPCREAILNVATDNAPAVEVYRRLGVAVHCRHQEGVGRLR